MFNKQNKTNKPLPWQKHLDRFIEIFEPKLQLLKDKWQQLQPREQQLVGAMAVFIVVVVFYGLVSGLISLKNNVANDVNGLSRFTAYSKQAATAYKGVSQVDANSFNDVSIDKIKGDITQVLQVENPDILIQGGQLTVNVPNAQFSQVMVLMDQFRKSYAIFPSQVSIIRQAQSGYISFNATFWVKQQ